MRGRCSFGHVYSRVEPGIPAAPASVIIGLVPEDYAVLSANGESPAVIIMGDIVANYRIRRPYFDPVHGPPFPCLRIIIAGTSCAAVVTYYGHRMRAGCTLYKDAATISRSGYPVAGDDAAVTRKSNPSAVANVFNDTTAAGPDLLPLSNENGPNRRPCSGDRPLNIVPFDRPVLAADG